MRIIVAVTNLLALCFHRFFSGFYNVSVNVCFLRSGAEAISGSKVVCVEYYDVFKKNKILTRTCAATICTYVFCADLFSFIVFVVLYFFIFLIS